MSFTETELAALKRAYARGVLEVAYDGVTTKYDNGAALLRRIRVMESEIAAQSGTGKVMSVFTTFNRG